MWDLDDVPDMPAGEALGNARLSAVDNCAADREFGKMRGAL